MTAHRPNIDRLLRIMARLRDPEGGCPWDRGQTFASIAPYTIEEAYEVADAIARGDRADLKDELGDLLFQVVFHAQMAEEAGDFRFDDVAGAIADKMERRHPHVFGAAEIRDAAAQTVAWEETKAGERAARAGLAAKPPGALEGVPLALPALLRAEKLGKRAARVGFDWTDTAGVVAKVQEEIGELAEARAAAEGAERLSHELGDILFAVAQLGRHLGINPETALREANDRFARRFGHVEDRLAETGREPAQATMQELDDLWCEAKRLEKKT